MKSLARKLSPDRVSLDRMNLDRMNLEALEDFASLRKPGRLLPAVAAVVLAISLAACTNGGSEATGNSGNSGGTVPTVNNTQPVVIDGGPLVNGQSVGDANLLFTTVTLCVPGTTTCQSIDHVQVDTGSTGLRILSSVLTLSLNITNINGQPIGNCVQYADTTYQWGPLAVADVQMAGEVASSVPIQVVGNTNFPAAPAGCSAGGTSVQTVTDLGANGILGVGLYRQDCGSVCTLTSTEPAGVYYGCPSTGCVIAPVPLAAQLQNPVWLFPQDNNGLAILLPQIGATGATTVSGSMIFGIGTQSDNAPGAVQAQAPDQNGNLTTTYKGVAYTGSFIDSGSNGYFFLDSTTTGIPECNPNTIAPGFYCPASTLNNLTAINSGPNPATGILVSTNIAFSVANAVTLFNAANGANTAFNNVAGTNPGAFDWGIPFFFGRTVFIGIEGQSAGTSVGPYWAY